MSKLDVPAGTWQIDPSHSGVNFSVRHMMVSKVRGAFGSFTGTISIPDNAARRHRRGVDRRGLDRHA